MASRLAEVTGSIRAKRQELATYFEKKNADGRFDWTAEERDKVRTLNTECDALGTELDTLTNDAMLETKHRAQVERINQVILPGSHGGRSGQRGAAGHDGFALMEGKGIGHRFIEHKGYTERTGKHFGLEIPDFEVKTLFQTSAGFDPFVSRLSTIALSPQQMPKVVDLIPVSQTSMHSVKWMLETTYTNNAATTAEAAAYGEAALAFTEQLSPIVKVAVFIPVTDEQLADEPRMRDTLNNRLSLMVRQKLDQKLLTAAGGGSDLMGLNNVVGINTQALGADPVPSAVFKAMTLIQTVGFAEPSGVIFNPSDWQGVKLLQTADGLYIWGHPSDAGPNRIWGLPVVSTTYQTQGIATIGDYVNHTELIYRQGLTFEVSNSHEDYFVKGKQAVRADIRVGFINTRPTALTKVTGIPA